MSKVPFPQANNIELIFAVLNDIGSEGLAKDEVAFKYGIDPRQGSYYLDALLYLGFVEKINTKYFLSNKGITTRLAPKDNMKKVFADHILEHPFIGVLYKECKGLERSKILTHVSTTIFNETGLSNSTSQRRADSIVRWFSWIERVECTKGGNI
ncbi:MAG: hypothetical protein MJ220_02825 [Bacilli bacterium]|nr:hypothetical protein [Bacilli bacterium]